MLAISENSQESTNKFLTWILWSSFLTWIVSLSLSLIFPEPVSLQLHNGNNNSVFILLLNVYWDTKYRCSCCCKDFNFIFSFFRYFSIFSLGKYFHYFLIVRVAFLKTTLFPLFPIFFLTKPTCHIRKKSREKAFAQNISIHVMRKRKRNEARRGSIFHDLEMQ